MGTWHVSDQEWARRWRWAGIAAAVGFVWWVLSASQYDVPLVLQYAVAGLGPGAAAAIAGVGLTITYQVTGVFNFAFGAIATFVAYVMWQLNIRWGIPLVIATLLAVAVVAPLLGVGLERFVYRPLQRRAASTSEKLLATLAVFAVFLGVTTVVWGAGSKSEAPQLFGSHAFHVAGDFVVAESTIGQGGVIAVLGLAVAALLRYTTLGRQMRAVVDRRQLAELVGVRANRVAAVAWALGCVFAGLAGVLYAPQQGLSPYGVTLLVLETFGVAVIARLQSMTLAIVGGLAVGVVQSMALRVQPQITDFWSGLSNVQPYLFVVALLLFLLVHRNLDELGAVGQTGAGVVAAVARRRRGRSRPWPAYAAFAIAIVAIGMSLHGPSMTVVQQMVALTVVFLSIVAVTGFSGHLALGQAGFAGVGALVTTKLANGVFPGMPRLPVLASMVIAAVIVVLLGILTGFPALRRRGLILGLATLAMGLALYFFVFENAYFLYGVSTSPRPSIFGLSLAGDHAMYLYELVVLAGALALTAWLRSGRLGRVLGAMRDSETGAVSIGLSLRRYKLFIFAASSLLAAVGGALLAQTAQTFDAESYSPLIGLFWFLAVVFAGLTYLSGAAVAAVLYVGLDHVIGRSDASVVVIGVLALLSVGLLREGGVVGGLLRLPVRRGLGLRRLRGDYLRTLGAPAVPPAPGVEELVPTALGRQLADELAR